MEKTKKLQILAIILTVCLVASLSFNAYQFLNCDGENSMTKTFTRQRKNYIRPDGIVQINATFDWSGSNLTMTIKVNDDDFFWADYIGLVFDLDKDGNLFEEVAYLLYAGNVTSPLPSGNRLEDWGGIYTIPVQLHPDPSPWHTCTFTEDEYTFNIELSKAKINFAQRMLTHVCYWDADADLDAALELPLQVAKERAIVWFEFEVYKP